MLEVSMGQVHQSLPRVELGGAISEVGSQAGNKSFQNEFVSSTIQTGTIMTTFLTRRLRTSMAPVNYTERSWETPSQSSRLEWREPQPGKRIGGVKWLNHKKPGSVHARDSGNSTQWLSCCGQCHIYVL